MRTQRNVAMKKKVTIYPYKLDAFSFNVDARMLEIASYRLTRRFGKANIVTLRSASVRASFV